MSNRVSNFPTNQQPDVEPGEIGTLVAKMEQLRGMSKPKTDTEVAERVQWYFRWCIDNDCRPGVEMMALSLGVTRQTLLDWQRKGGRRGETITAAKQLLAALLEQWGVCGKLNPATLCFLMKNHFAYQDNVQIDVGRKEDDKPQSLDEIAARYGVTQQRIDTAGDPLPVAEFADE